MRRSKIMQSGMNRRKIFSSEISPCIRLAVMETSLNWLGSWNMFLTDHPIGHRSVQQCRWTCPQRTRFMAGCRLTGLTISEKYYSVRQRSKYCVLTSSLLIQYFQLDCLSLVIQTSRHVDVPSLKLLQTPTHMAAYAGNVFCLQWLLDHGSDPLRWVFQHRITFYQRVFQVSFWFYRITWRKPHCTKLLELVHWRQFRCW